MNLKSLELFGFKSFMRKLDIHFSDGITVIVGPNGCGKTNVTDALRWVLGEANARNLRGKAMQDLIFNGTRDYKPLNVAEVSLTIDNSSGVLPVEYTDVTVTRRVFRNGESEFLINKIPGRLRDIQDLFMDTGLGSRAYSVIEREMVEMVLADQPEKRRELLEEAAGIMKYKIRERQARRKLEATDEDMQRIEDVLREVERQVRSLKRQVGAAQRFQEARDRQRQLEIALSMVDVVAMRRGEEECREALEEHLTERDGASGRLAALETDIESRRLEATVAEAALTEMQREVDAIGEEARSLESENLVRRERREALLERGRRLETERKELQERVEAAGLRRVELDDRLGTLESALAEVEESLRTAQASLENVESDLEGRRRHLAEARAAAEEAGTQVSKVKEDLANLDAHGEHLADRGAVLGEEKASLVQSLGGREEEVRRADARSGEAREEITRLTGDIGGAERERVELDGRRDVNRDEESRLSVAMESTRSTLEMLRGLRDSYEGFGEGPRTLLSRNGGRLAALADGLRVDRQDLIPALEAALDATVQFVVAPTGEDAVSAVRSLGDGDGRATIADRDAFRALRADAPELPSDPAIVGRARDFLAVPEEDAPVLDHLLARVAIVDTLENAVRLARREDCRGLRFVTRAGEWAEFPGLVHGGAPSGAEDTRILGRADRIVGLEATLADLERQRAEIRQAAQELANRREELSQEMDRLVAARDAARDRLSDEDKALERAQAELSAARDRLATVEREQGELEVRRRSLEEQRTVRQQELVRVEEIRDRLDGDRVRREEELAASAEDRDRARQDSHDRRLDLERSRAELEKIRLERTTLAESRSADEQGIARRAEEIEATDRSVGELDRELEEGNARFVVKAEELEQRRTVRDRAAEERSRVLEALRGIETERTRWSRLRDDSAQHVHDREMKLMKLESARTELVGRIERDFLVNLMLPDAPRVHGSLLEADEETLTTARRELDDLRRLIDRMGAVNLVALEQYERESRRLEFLATQKQDLDEAREKLRRTIRKINRKARSLFMETLEQVRINFQQTFGTLFLGGQADIRLSGDEDPLHAPIEIFARPRGKRLASISLMSSGERSLTAVAFLFAIYLVKPSPFCILDEVDAPLDDANIGRFLDMLKKVAQKTQFVMITHNKKTMEVADFLYGVTMGEPGISKLVSVNLGPEGRVTATDEDGVVKDLDLDDELVMEGSA
jgi:chromosome segregation protein